jgi:N-acetylglucosaminyl-diphospho-decaprenol L-rhamnosyltransferase
VRAAGILVNYRTSELTLRAVEALRPELAALGPAAVVVVDNDSADGSFERLCAGVRERGWQDVAVVASPRNGGYGYGINVGVRHFLDRGVGPDYFHVINTDAFPAPGSVARLVAFLDAHPDGGMAGGRIDSASGEEQPCGAFRFPSPLAELEAAASFGPLSRLLRDRAVAIEPMPTDSQPVDWLSGTSMLIRRQVFEQGLYFDEGFFLYFEEIDFARRLRDAGWRSYYVADAPIEHLHSVSTGLADQNRPLPDYWFESRHRYYLKHHGRAYALTTDAAWLAGYLLFRAKRAVTGRPSAIRAHMLRNFLRTRTLHLRRPAAPS